MLFVFLNNGYVICLVRSLKLKIFLFSDKHQDSREIERFSHNEFRSI